MEIRMGGQSVDRGGLADAFGDNQVTQSAQVSAL